MKKLFFAAAIMAAATLTGCGNKTNSAAGEGVDSVEATATDANSQTLAAADSLLSVLGENLSAKDAKSLQATIESIKAKYDELVKLGLVDEAETYAAKLKEYLAEHADEVKAVAAGNTTVSELVGKVTNLSSTAEEAKQAVKEGAQEAVDNAKEAVNEKVEATKEEAKQKVNSAVDKALNKALGGN